MAVDIRMKQELAEMDKEYGGENMYKMLGPTSLSWTSVDSSRMYMFTSHLKQCLTLLNPQVPRLATGMENAIGKENKSAYFKLEGTWEVIAVIDKFRFPKEMIEKDPKIRESRSIPSFFIIRKRISTRLWKSLSLRIRQSALDMPTIRSSWILLV